MTALIFAVSVAQAGLLAWWIHDTRRLIAMNIHCPNCRHYGTACDVCWETPKRSTER